jgi:NADH-quinone oxidoreductase subunit H
MAEYGSMFLVSALAAILFFGGWYGPLPIFQSLAYQPGEQDFRLAGALVNVVGVTNLIFKSTVGVVFMIWVRWTFPRLRIDQVITMCWKYCVPIAAVAFVGSVFVWQYLGWPWIKDIAPSQPVLAVREGWVLEVQAPAIEAVDETEAASDVGHAEIDVKAAVRAPVYEKEARRPAGGAVR